MTTLRAAMIIIGVAVILIFTTIGVVVVWLLLRRAIA